MADFSITGEVRLNSDPAEKSTSKWTVAAGQMIADFAKKAASELSNVVKSGLEYNASMQSYLTNFKVMLGSEEQAAEKLAEIRKMAASTPFSLDDLTDGTQTLLQFGIAVDDTTGVLQQLGDISLGNADKLQTLVRAYGKMSSAQKVTLENVNMMIDAGFNPLNQICTATGESMADLYKRISDGKVSFAELESAVASATSQGGQFYNGMLEASQTFSGRMSTLKDNVSALTGELTGGLFEALGELVVKVNEAAVSFLDDEEKMSQLKDTLGTLASVVTAAGAAFVTYKGYLALTTAATIAHTTYTAAMTAAHKAAATGATGLKLALAALNAVINANPVGLLVSALAALAAGLVTAYHTSETFRNVVDSAFDWIKDKAQTAIGAVVDWINELDARLKGAAAALSNLKNGFEAAKQAYNAAYNDSMDGYNQAKMDKAAQKRKQLHEERVRQSQKEKAAAEAAAAASTEAATTITSNAGKTAAAAKNAADAVVKSVADTETTVKDGALKTVETVRTIAADGTEAVTQSIQDSAATSLDGLWKVLKAEMDTGVLGTVDSLMQAVQQGDWLGIGQWVAGTLYAGLTADQQIQIENFALGLVQQLNAALGEMQTDLAQAAWDLGRQLYDGITSGFGDVLLRTKELGAALQSTWEALKGPLSAAAQAISAALNGGLISAFPAIYTAVGTLIGSIGAAVQGLLTAISTALSATIFGIPAGLVIAGAAVALGAAIAAIVANIGKGKPSSNPGGGGGGGSGAASSGGKTSVVATDTDISTITGADGTKTTTKTITETLRDEAGNLTTKVTKIITETGTKLVDGVERSFTKVTTSVDGIVQKVDTTLEDIAKKPLPKPDKPETPEKPDTDTPPPSPGEDALGDALQDNTAALEQANAKLTEMMRQADSLVLSDNMAVSSTVAASGSAQIAQAAAGYHKQTTNITQNIYSKAQTAADLMREARWEADRAKAQGR
ncbi:MAG: hypothetical protein KH706_01415 [Faecalibacterium prausnitzii]|nr:hypothetical protein [Faecalibacterium prausnitzii]